MGLTNWLNGVAAALQAANAEQLSAITQRAHESAIAAEQETAAFYAKAEASRKSNGGSVPDSLVDEMIADFQRNFNGVSGHQP